MVNFQLKKTLRGLFLYLLDQSSLLNTIQSFLLLGDLGVLWIPSVCLENRAGQSVSTAPSIDFLLMEQLKLDSQQRGSHG